MPPEIKTDQATILSEALALVHESGLDALTARSLAARLHCSVQPIFRCFETMDALKSAVIKAIQSQWDQALLAALRGEEQGFAAMGLTYIRFARNEPQFFKILFMSDGFGNGNLETVAGSTTGDGEVIALLCNTTGLSPALAQLLYTSIWLTTHGIAVMLATNSLQIDEAQIERLLKHTYEGLIYSLKKDMEEAQ